MNEHRLLRKDNQILIQLVKADDHFVYTRDQKILDTSGMHCTATVSANAHRLLQQSVDAIHQYPSIHTGKFDIPELDTNSKTILQDSDFSKVYWSLSSSSCFEAACKIALHVTGKSHIVAVPHGYNAGSFLGNCVNYEYSRAKKYEKILSPVNPWEGDIITTIEQHHETIAAVVVEAWYQEFGVVKIEQTQEINRLCKKYNIMLICDETITGYYRCGTAWGHQAVGLDVDMCYTGKGLNNGLLPVGALMLTEQVAQQVKEKFNGHFDCSNTLNENPLSVQTAATCWDAVRNMDRFNLFEHCQRAFDNEIVGSHQLVGIKLKRPLDANKLLENGVFARCKGDVVCLTPPYNWDENVFDFFYDAIKDLI